MADRQRDRAIVSSLHTIATRTWKPPTGPDRDAVLDQIRERAGGRTDLLIEAAGILLGVRPDNEHDPRHRQATAGARMLLEAADVAEDDERVREWMPVGAERRVRWRKPEAPTGWGPDVHA